MVQNGMPANMGYDWKEEDTPTTLGIPVELPRNMTEQLAEQLMGSQQREIASKEREITSKEREISRLEELLKERKDEICE